MPSSYYERLGVISGAGSADEELRLSPAALFAKARFRQCLVALGGDESPQAVILRMRVLIYLGKHHDVIRAEMLDTISDLPLPLRAQATALLAKAYYRADLRLPAESTRARAMSLAEESGDVTALAVARYYTALLRLSEGVLDEAEHYADLVVDHPEWGPAAMDVRAWVHAKRGDYKRQLRELLDAYSAIQGEDVWGKAAILHAASSLARDLYDTTCAQNIELRAERLDWSEDTRVQECYTFRYLGWCAALAGNALRAFEHFARADSCAPNEAHRVLINVDRAFIAHYKGEKDTENRYLEIGRYLADQTDWRKTDEAQTALLLLAQMVSFRDAEEATRIVRRYTEITVPISPLLSFGGVDRRREALEQYTAGIVYRARDDREAAIAALKNALSIWRSVDYHWRAALAASHLGEITGRSQYADLAHRLIRMHVPHAFFVPESTVASGVARSRIEHPDIARLSPARRDVLFAYMDGLTNQEIAAKLNISRQGVKNRMSEIYRHFNVHSSRELQSEMRRRGIH